MGSKTVDRNSLQRQLINQDLETLAPGSGAVHYALCTILKVYDKETLKTSQISDKLQARINKAPGLLFADVQLNTTGEIVTVAFQGTEHEIYTLYGNSVQLEGLDAKIVFRNTDLKSGKLQLQRVFQTETISLVDATESFDIGNIV